MRMPAQRLVTETQTKYKGQPTKILVALAKEWKERKHYVTAEIKVFPYPDKNKDVVQFKKVQERATSMFKCRKQGFFDLGLLSLKGGNRITAEVYKIMKSRRNCL